MVRQSVSPLIYRCIDELKTWTSVQRYATAQQQLLPWQGLVSSPIGGLDRTPTWSRQYSSHETNSSSWGGHGHGPAHTDHSGDGNRVVRPLVLTWYCMVSSLSMMMVQLCHHMLLVIHRGRGFYCDAAAERFHSPESV